MILINKPTASKKDTVSYYVAPVKTLYIGKLFNLYSVSLKWNFDTAPKIFMPNVSNHLSCDIRKGVNLSAWQEPLLLTFFITKHRAIYHCLWFTKLLNIWVCKVAEYKYLNLLVPVQFNCNTQLNSLKTGGWPIKVSLSTVFSQLQHCWISPIWV